MLNRVSIIGFVLFIITSSCSISKRHYRKGFFVQKKHSHKSETIASNNASQNQTNSFDKKLIDASLSNQIVIEEVLKPSITRTDTCGDKLFFKKGDILLVKVLEITDKTVRYKRCDNLTGPDYTTSKGKLEMIKYANGFSESIDAPAYDYEENSNDPYVSSKKDEPTEPPKVHPKAWYALIWLISSILLGFTIIISLILARQAKRDIKANPKKYKGYILASVVYTISLILICLIVLILLLALIGAL
ncbi:MAG: hypothetical protein AB7O73_11020 [Bacteroidia bacterium]